MKKEKPIISRRRILKGTVSAAFAAPLLASAASAKTESAKAAPKKKMAAGKLHFFTPSEFVLVEELTEIIIPADEHSPGAKAAKCAAYIDFRLSEAFAEEERRQWREGLQQVNQLAREMHQKPFMRCSEDERVSVVTRMAAGEANPQLPEEKFFAELKRRTASAYYTSRIGLHDELEYKGNTYLREYAGVELK